MTNNILIVEDEIKLQNILKEYLVNAGFKVAGASDGEQALTMFKKDNYDLIILDIMIPKIDGWSVLRRIRKTSNIPILILSSRGEDDDKMMGYELGTDEYTTKPCSPKIVVAKVEALLKRANGNIKKTDKIEIGNIIINEKEKKVFVDSNIIELTSTEYKLLLHMIKNKGIILSREQIINFVWGYNYFGDIRAVDTYIKRLRKKIGSSYIKTVTGFGYKIEEIRNEK